MRFEKFSDEEYSAVAKNHEILNALLKHKDESFRLISYPGWELFFITWAKTHGLWNKLKVELRKPTVHIGTLAGAIHAVKEGAGLAVIPTHCLFEELKSGKLVELQPKKGVDAACPIYLAKKIGSKSPKRVEHVLDLLRQAKRDLN